MRHRRRRLAAALTVACAFAVSGCGSSPDSGNAPARVARATVDLPATLAGLTPRQESASRLVARNNAPTYLSSVSLYSLRKGELVEGTLQVSRLQDESRFRSSKFRRTLVNRIGEGNPVEVRLGSSSVFLTRGVRQNIAVWFRGASFAVLTTRVDFERPRSLLRAALGVDL